VSPESRHEQGFTRSQKYHLEEAIALHSLRPLDHAPFSPVPPPNPSDYLSCHTNPRLNACVEAVDTFGLHRRLNPIRLHKKLNIGRLKPEVSLYFIHPHFDIKTQEEEAYVLDIREVNVASRYCFGSFRVLDAALQLI
jgi:hypothetical protein